MKKRSKLRQTPLKAKCTTADPVKDQTADSCEISDGTALLMHAEQKPSSDRCSLEHIVVPIQYLLTKPHRQERSMGISELHTKEAYSSSRTSTVHAKNLQTRQKTYKTAHFLCYDCPLRNKSCLVIEVIGMWNTACILVDSRRRPCTARHVSSEQQTRNTAHLLVDVF